MIERYLPKSKWARPEKMRNETKAIIVHWTANPGQRAAGVHRYWRERTDSYGSAHAIVDFDGTVFLTLPWDEIGYHVGSSKGYTELAHRLFTEKGAINPNLQCVGIELCHTNWEGEFTDETWKSAVKLAAQLCRQYHLKPFTDVLTHQMVVGWKNCPRWFVDHPDDFELFRWEVMDRM